MSDTTYFKSRLNNRDITKWPSCPLKRSVMSFEVCSRSRSLWSFDQARQAETFHIDI